MRRVLRRAMSLIVLAVFAASLPASALSNAAEPLTAAEWSRIIFVTPDREIDLTQKGLAAAAPAPPPPALQTSSEQTPPKQGPQQNRMPDVWTGRLGRVRRRRRNNR